MNKISLKYLLLILGLVGITVNAFAETAYVSDNLRVGIRPGPDKGFAPVAVVKTGMKLEVLDKQNDYLKIKTEDGTTGWIKSIYVLNEPPAIIKLQALETKHQELTAKASEMTTSIVNLESTNRSLNEQVTELEKDRTRIQLLLAKSASSQEQEQSTWLWWLIALVVLGAGGFFAGIQYSRQQAMKRLGGLRI